MNQSISTELSRRTLLAHSLALAGLVPFTRDSAAIVPTLMVTNVTALYSVEVARIAVPRTADEVSEYVRTWPGKVAVGGGRYSMGGQVAVRGGLHLDMRQLNQLVWLRPSERTARVQAGMRWRDLQDHLDPVNLAVKTMQSYSNFTVGGSVSVNAHGRYIGHGPLGHTVRALQLVLASGEVVEVSPTQTPKLFQAAIGGYGAIGVITEVELELAENVPIERVVEHVPLERYVEHFKEHVLRDKTVVLHNADLLPPAFNAPVSVTWRRAASNKPLTEMTRLVPRGQTYGMEQNTLWALTELPGGHSSRTAVVQPMLLTKPAVKWLNCEASLDVAELEPRTRMMSTYVLQEYFIPERHFLSFVRGIAEVLQTHKVEALNLSVRHSPADRVALLPWASEDVFSFVLYYKQRTYQSAQESVQRWTSKLIDLALTHEGRYYLPYQLHASKAQFERAYPEIEEFRRIKKQVDPTAKLSNELWRKYL